MKGVKTLPATPVIQPGRVLLEACTLNGAIFWSQFIWRIGDNATLGPCALHPFLQRSIVTLGMLRIPSGSTAGAYVDKQQEVIG